MCLAIHDDGADCACTACAMQRIILRQQANIVELKNLCSELREVLAAVEARSKERGIKLQEIYVFAGRPMPVEYNPKKAAEIEHRIRGDMLAIRRICLR